MIGTRIWTGTISRIGFGLENVTEVVYKLESWNGICYNDLNSICDGKWAGTREYYNRIELETGTSITQGFNNENLEKNYK